MALYRCNVPSPITMEFVVGCGANQSADGGYRNFVTFDANWFKAHVKKFYIRTYYKNNTSNQLIGTDGTKLSFYLNNYPGAVTNNTGYYKTNVLSLTSDYQEYPMSDIIAEAGSYSYVHLQLGTSNTRYGAWHQIKLELQ